MSHTISPVLRYKEDTCSPFACAKCVCQCSFVTFLVLTFVGYFIFYYGKPSDIMLANRNNDAKQEFLKVEKSFQFVKSEIKNDDWRNDNIDSDIEIQMNLNKKEHNTKKVKTSKTVHLKKDNIDHHDANLYNSEDNELIAGESKHEVNHPNEIKHDVLSKETYDDKPGSSFNKEQKIKPEGFEHWKRFINEGNNVVVGKVYEKCDGKKQIGVVLLMKDKLNGGNKIRTIINATFSTPISKATVYLRSFYGGRLLYNNKWDFCKRLRLESLTTKSTNDKELKPLLCPINKGEHSLVRDIHISSLLPSGTFSIRVWIDDDNGHNTICCSKSKIVL